MSAERIQKILAAAGYGSRRSCEELIAAGRVRVNGKPAALGDKADPDRDRITLDGKDVSVEQKRYVAVYKPKWVVSSLDPQGERKTVRDLVPFQERLYPVGRLDLESEGLMLLTNDGELANRMTHPRYELEKEYLVLLSEMPDEAQLEAWRRGIVLEDRKTLPANVTMAGKDNSGGWRVRVVMKEGRKRQIREIAQHLGLFVMRLKRVRMGPLSLGTLRPGKWRELKGSEIAALRNATAPRAKSGKDRKKR